jgi:hypothetical protein
MKRPSPYRRGRFVLRLPATLLPVLVLLPIVMLLSSCGGPDVEEQLQGKWKNGDGNLIRFGAENTAFIGQEGLSGEGECRFEITGDSVRVTTLPGEEQQTNTYYMRLAGDTLYLDAIALERPGHRQRISSEDFALRTGKPSYKLHFTRIAEKP